MAERRERTSYAPGPRRGSISGALMPRLRPTSTAASSAGRPRYHRPEAGGYGMFQIDGKNVAGLGRNEHTTCPRSGTST